MKSFLSFRALALAAVVAASASAQTFFVSRDASLLRTDLSNFNTFTLSDNIHAMDFDDNGVLWATSRDDNELGKWELYTIDDPYGTPTLNLVANNIEGVTPSIAWIGGTLYGLQAFDSGSGFFSRLVTINTATGSLTAIGATGDTSISGGGVEYDPATGAMYALNHNPGSLNTLDWTLSSNADPAATLVGAFSGETNIRSSGLGHLDATGQLYATITDRSTLTPALYSVDKSDGTLSQMIDLTPYLGVGAGGSGIAVIPEPSSILLVLGGLGALIGRRR